MLCTCTLYHPQCCAHVLCIIPNVVYMYSVSSPMLCTCTLYHPQCCAHVLCIIPNVVYMYSVSSPMLCTCTLYHPQCCAHVLCILQVRECVAAALQSLPLAIGTAAMQQLCSTDLLPALLHCSTHKVTAALQHSQGNCCTAARTR